MNAEIGCRVFFKSITMMTPPHLQSNDYQDIGRGEPREDEEEEAAMVSEAC